MSGIPSLLRRVPAGKLGAALIAFVMTNPEDLGAEEDETLLG